VKSSCLEPGSVYWAAQDWLLPLKVGRSTTAVNNTDIDRPILRDVDLLEEAGAFKLAIQPTSKCCSVVVCLRTSSPSAENLDTRIGRNK
jgi:hypothetical protein